MHIEIIININKYHFSRDWLVTWKEEDPSTRKIPEGGTTFRWVYVKFRFVWYQVEKDLELREGIQNSGRQKQKCDLDPSAVFTGVSNYPSAELLQSDRGNAIKKMSAFIAVIWISHALNDLLPFLFRLSSVLRSSEQRQFTCCQDLPIP